MSESGCPKYGTLSYSHCTGRTESDLFCIEGPHSSILWFDLGLMTLSLKIET